MPETMTAKDARAPRFEPLERGRRDILLRLLAARKKARRYFRSLRESYERRRDAAPGGIRGAEADAWAELLDIAAESAAESDRLLARAAGLLIPGLEAAAAAALAGYPAAFPTLVLDGRRHTFAPRCELVPPFRMVDAEGPDLVDLDARPSPR